MEKLKQNSDNMTNAMTQLQKLVDGVKDTVKKEDIEKVIREAKEAMRQQQLQHQQQQDQQRQADLEASKIKTESTPKKEDESKVEEEEMRSKRVQESEGSKKEAKAYRVENRNWGDQRKLDLIGNKDGFAVWKERAISHLVQGRPEILKLLNWAEKKKESIKEKDEEEASEERGIEDGALVSFMMYGAIKYIMVDAMRRYVRSPSYVSPSPSHAAGARRSAS